MVSEAAPVVASSTLAPSNAAQSSQVISTQNITSSKYKLDTTINQDFSMIKNDAEQNSYSMSTMATLAYVPREDQPEKLQFISILTYNRELSYEMPDGHDDAVEDPFFAVTKGVKISDSIKQNTGLQSFRYGLSSTIGTSRESQRASKQFGFGPRVMHAMKWGFATFAQRLAYTYTVFEREVRLDQKINNPHAIALKNTLKFDLGADFDLTFLAEVINTISFQNVNRTFLTSQASLGYGVNDNLSLSVGVSTDKASTQSADGQRTEVKIYDPDLTAYQAGIELKF